MELRVRFQPIIDVWKRKRIGYEATMRGNRGEGAVEMLAQAKQSGRTMELDLQARSVAVREGLSLLGQDQRLFLNIAPETLQNRLHDYLKDIPLDCIVLEITEQAPVRDLERLRESLAVYCERGLILALDDFGRGFSNLELFTRWPIHYLKLDKSFARTLQGPRTAETVKGLARMCQDAGIGMIVEGVETEEQRERLLDLGVRYMQGFYFGVPFSLVPSCL